MSRFFAGPDSASESESAESDQEERERKQKKDTDRFTSIFAASDTEDEGRRVVRSARDKRFEELQTVVKTLRNHRNIKDIGKVSTDFGNLMKAHQKARNIIDKQGTPGFYIRALAELEDFCNERWANKADISNKPSVKDLQALRNQVRRYNKTYDDDIKAFREQPTAAKFEDMAEESTTEEDADDDEAVEGGPSAENKRRPSKDEPNPFLKSKSGDAESTTGSETDEDDWSTDTDTGTETSGTDEDRIADVFRRDKDTGTGKDKDRTAKDKRKKRRKEKHTHREQADEDVDDAFNRNKARPQLFPGMKETDITHAKALEKLDEIIAQRRRGGMGEQIELLEELRTVSQRHNLGPAMDVKILFTIINLVFNSARADGMRSEQWRRCTETITEMLEILRQNPNIRTQEEVADEDENVSDMSSPLIVRSSVLLMVERLDDEYLKILQNTDPHSPEYLQRLREEFKVENILTTAQRQYENRHSIVASDRSRMYLRRIRHLYYRFDKSCLCRAVTRYPGSPAAADENVEPQQQNGNVVANGTAAEIGKKERKTSKSSVEQADAPDGSAQPSTEQQQSAPQQQPAMSALDMMADLSSKVIQLCLGDRDLENMAVTAALHHAYFLAHHGYYFEAKDIFHSLELERRVDDPNTTEAAKVLYNRSVVRLGIAAFCHGLYSEAHELLMDIQSSGKVRELLGQGLVPARDFEKTPEQQYKERENQVPFHQQINLDILEAVYLLSAMLLEMPYLTAHEKDYRRRQISRNFHYHLRQYERHTIVGPPDSLAEHIIVASKHMRQGEWRECWQLVTADRLTRRAWKYIFNWNVLEAFYEQKVKEASLKCFMFTTAPLYAQLAMPLLEKKFDLSKEQVMAVLTYLIMKEELACRIDVGSDSIAIMRANADGLHQVARQVAEKGLKMLENNEEMLKAPQGMGGMRGHQGGDRYQHRGGYGGGGGYRGGGGGGGYRGGRGGGGYGRGGYDRDGGGGGGHRYGDRDDRDRHGGDRYGGGGGDYGGGQRSYQQRTQRV